MYKSGLSLFIYFFLLNLRLFICLRSKFGPKTLWCPLLHH